MEKVSNKKMHNLRHASGQRNWFPFMQSKWSFLSYGAYLQITHSQRKALIDKIVRNKQKVYSLIRKFCGYVGHFEMEVSILGSMYWTIHLRQEVGIS